MTDCANNEISNRNVGGLEHDRGRMTDLSVLVSRVKRQADDRQSCLCQGIKRFTIGRRGNDPELA